MIGVILRNIRKLKGITQKEIGKKLNLAESSISNYETQYSNITFETAIKFIEECNFELVVIDKDNKKMYTISELSKEMDF